MRAILDSMAQGFDTWLRAFFGDGFWVLWVVIVAVVAFFVWLP